MVCGEQIRRGDSGHITTVLMTGIGNAQDFNKFLLIHGSSLPSPLIIGEKVYPTDVI